MFLKVYVVFSKKFPLQMSIYLITCTNVMQPHRHFTPSHHSTDTQNQFVWFIFAHPCRCVLMKAWNGSTVWENSALGNRTSIQTHSLLTAKNAFHNTELLTTIHESYCRQFKIQINRNRLLSLHEYDTEVSLYIISHLLDLRWGNLNQVCCSKLNRKVTMLQVCMHSLT